METPLISVPGRTDSRLFFGGEKRRFGDIGFELPVLRHFDLDAFVVFLLFPHFG